MESIVADDRVPSFQPKPAVTEAGDAGAAAASNHHAAPPPPSRRKSSAAMLKDRAMSTQPVEDTGQKLEAEYIQVTCVAIVA